MPCRVAVQEPLSAHVNPEALEKRTQDFTIELKNYLHEHFVEFASKKGLLTEPAAVEQLVRKWAYMVRFADWCYHEGVINRSMFCNWVVGMVKEHMQEPEADASFSANWNVMEMMLPLIINILPDLCRLSDEILLPQLITVCIQRYMRECVMLKPTRPDQASAPAGAAQQSQQNLGGAPWQVQAGMAGSAGGVSGAEASLIGESTVNVLCNVKKLVKSLLLLCPEAYLALAPEMQTAWRLIESEPGVREIDAAALKSIVRKAGGDAMTALPSMPLSMSWSQDVWSQDLCKASRLAGECEFEKLMYEYVDALDKCCRHAGGCDVQKLKEMLDMERERDRERLRQQSPAVWQKVFQEHCRARSIVRIMCTWCVSHCREHVGESIYIVAALLKGLSDVLSQVFNVEVEDSGSQPGQQEMLLCGGADGVVGGEVQTHSDDYPLQGYLEAFVLSFVPKEGAEESEMSRLECLVAELMRCGLMSHDAWLHSMIASGAFLPGPAKVCILEMCARQGEVDLMRAHVTGRVFLCWRGLRWPTALPWHRVGPKLATLATAPPSPPALHRHVLRPVANVHPARVSLPCGGAPGKRHDVHKTCVCLCRWTHSRSGSSGCSRISRSSRRRGTTHVSAASCCAASTSSTWRLVPATLRTRSTDSCSGVLPI